MELRDLVVTPLLIIVVYTLAYFIRPYVTDDVTRKYFFPALTAKVFGALALGFIYQFYYHGGDTFNYHTHGSRPIWEAFVESPAKAIQLCFGDPRHFIGLSNYAYRIYFLTDPSSFFIVRLSFFFDVFTFSAYTATGVFFSVISMVGMWMFFLTFYKQAPSLHRWFAFAAFFIPSVIFWGSGILKDTVVLACLGIATFQVYKLFIERRYSLSGVALLLVTLWAIFLIRKFVLQAYLPATVLWIFFYYFTNVRSVVWRAMVAPILVILFVLSGYVLVTQVGVDDPKYAVENLARTAEVTAYDIRFWSGKDAGSGYTLGELDGSIGSVLRLAPQAVNVALFRPYLWEVKNSLMLFSALESLFLLLFSVFVVVKQRRHLFRALQNHNVIFGLFFSILFAFATGVSTFNFGTLARYKIPLMPFFIVSLALVYNYGKSERKLEEFASSE